MKKNRPLRRPSFEILFASSLRILRNSPDFPAKLLISFVISAGRTILGTQVSAEFDYSRGVPFGGNNPERCRR